MDDSIGLLLLFQLVLIMLNAIFASAEIAVLSISETKLEHMADDGNGRAKKLYKLAKEPARFLATKTFYGAHGLPITDALAGNIAWQAALVAHRTGLGIYDDFVGVIVYPEPFRVRRRFADEIGLVHEFDDELYGETWDGGPVIVSWGTDEEEGVQVVLHEFAHRLDLADGALDGVPPLPPSLPRARWESVMETALQRLQDELDTGKSPPLDPYAEEGPEEFFPVATETFFTEPAALAAWDPALFEALAEVYALRPGPMVDFSCKTA